MRIIRGTGCVTDRADTRRPILERGSFRDLNEMGMEMDFFADPLGLRKCCAT